MSVILEANNILKTYSKKTALQIDELVFNEGEIVTVCGSNGAGKSTLLRILALLDFPDEGTIRYHGKNITGHGDWFSNRKEITMVDQNPFAFNWTVFQNAAYGLKLRKTASADLEKQVMDALDKVGLCGLAKQKARTLSGGEIQRMAIARAIVCGPRVLIMDEPTAHVDSSRVRDVEDLIKELRDKKNVSVIIASHDHQQALRISDRIIRIEKGRALPRQNRIMKGNLDKQNDQLTVSLDTK